MNISSMYLFAYEVGLLQVKVPLVAMKGGVDLQKYVDVLLPSAPATIKMVQVLRSFPNLNISSSCALREVCGKSKWKFKMAFAMKGGGGLEGVSFAIKLF